MLVCVTGILEMAISTETSRTNHDLFANIYAKRVPSVNQVVDPQIRKGSSHARPLQSLHGNPHNQR